MTTGDIITLADAKSFLNIQGNASDETLGGIISAASNMWVRRCGPVASAAYDEWYDGGGTIITLRHFPVLSVSLVEENVTGLPYTLTEATLEADGYRGAWGYSVENFSGTLTRRSAGVDTFFAYGSRNVHVVYTAGYAEAPADVVLAVKLLVKHMWDTQRGGQKRPGQGGDDTPAAGMWPARAEEIARFYEIPGIG